MGARRCERERETAAAPAREALPDGVHLADVEPRAEQQAVELDEIGLVHAAQRRADEARRAAADQDERDVVAAHAARHLTDAVRGSERLAPRNRVVSDQRGDRGVGGGVRFGRDDDAGGDRVQPLLQRGGRGAGHRVRRLAEGVNPDALPSPHVELAQRAGGQRTGSRAGDGRVVQLDEQCAAARRGILRDGGRSEGGEVGVRRERAIDHGGVNVSARGASS